MSEERAEPRPVLLHHAFSSGARGIGKMLLGRRLLTYALSVTVLLWLWNWYATWLGIPLLFPTIGMVLETLFERVGNGLLFRDARLSMARIVAGFSIGSAVGVLLGLLMGSFRVLRAVATPFVQFFRFVPPLAWFAPVLLWFGTGETSRILLIIYTTTFIVTLNTIAGVDAVEVNKQRMATSFGANPWQIFSLITLPASAGHIVVGMRIAMGNSFMTVVAAEMLAAKAGLGALIFRGLQLLDLTRVFTGILALGLLDWLTDRAFRAAAARFGGRFMGGIEVR